MGRIIHKRDDKGYCKRGMGVLFIFVLATMGEKEVRRLSVSLKQLFGICVYMILKQNY